MGRGNEPRDGDGAPIERRAIAKLGISAQSTEQRSDQLAAGVGEEQEGAARIRHDVVL
jgi:hypothetical protein